MGRMPAWAQPAPGRPPALILPLAGAAVPPSGPYAGVPGLGPLGRRWRLHTRIAYRHHSARVLVSLQGGLALGEGGELLWGRALGPPPL